MSYNDIDFRINLIYDYLYNNNSDICYNNKKLYTKNINIEDIKASVDFDYKNILDKNIEFDKKEKLSILFDLSNNNDDNHSAKIIITKYDQNEPLNDLTN